MTLATFLDGMKHSPIRNYGGIPGVTSWLIGAPSDRGLVRLMECSRTHHEPIVPHSHRFDFHCQVLAGVVHNVLWTPDEAGDMYTQTAIRYNGRPGEYTRVGSSRAAWRSDAQIYTAGSEYAMTAEQVHSIYFARGTSVLFFESPSKHATSVFLEPFVDGETVPTFKVEPWAFKRGAQ